MHYIVREHVPMRPSIPADSSEPTKCRRNWLGMCRSSKRSSPLLNGYGRDQKRDVITAEEARRLKDTVRDMLFNALNKADVSNADFERSISSERLYPYCGVTRKAKPRGRPRKGGGDA